jgi:hypothetical protein
VASRLLSPESAPAWGALAATWAAASGQPSAAAVLAELAVVAPAPPPPAGASPSPRAGGGGQGTAMPPSLQAIVWGGVATGALALLAGALVAVWYHARVVRPARFRTGLGLPPGHRAPTQEEAHGGAPPAVA